MDRFVASMMDAGFNLVSMTFGWRMNAIWWAYLATKDLESSVQARQMDIIAHVNPRYPPTYITDGNQPDTFRDHAKAMVQALDRHDVDYVFNFYEASEALLDHTYTGRLDTKHGRDNLEKTIAFRMQRMAGLATNHAVRSDVPVSVSLAIIDDQAQRQEGMRAMHGSDVPLAVGMVWRPESEMLSSRSRPP